MKQPQRHALRHLISMIVAVIAIKSPQDVILRCCPANDRRPAYSEADIQTSDLDAIAFGQGPGAFTGVRIAVGVIQGLAFAHDTPCHPQFRSLNALAQRYADEHTHVAAAIDARMQEIYWGLFMKNELGLMQQIVR